MKNLFFNLKKYLSQTSWEKILNIKYLLDNNNYKSKKILVICLSSIGDVVSNTSVFSNIREVYKNAEINILIESHCEIIVKHNKIFQNIISYNRKKIINDDDSILKLINELVLKQYDLVINLHTSPRSAYFAKLTECENILGLYVDENDKIFVKGNAWMLHRFINSINGNNNYSTIFNYLSILHKSISNDLQKKYNVMVPVDEINKKKLNIWWNKQGFNNKKNIVAINTGSNAPNRRWITDYWIKFIDLLIENNFNPFFIGGPNDKFRLKKIQSKLKVKIPNLFEDGNNLLIDTEAINKADYLVSPDTCMIHIAGAVNTPVLEIIGPGYLPTLSPLSLVVSTDELNCLGCQSYTCELKNPQYHICMKKLKPKNLFETFLLLVRIQKNKNVFYESQKQLSKKYNLKLYMVGNEKHNRFFNILEKNERENEKNMVLKIIFFIFWSYVNKEEKNDICETLKLYLNSINYNKSKFNLEIDFFLKLLSKLLDIIKKQVCFVKGNFNEFLKLEKQVVNHEFRFILDQILYFKPFPKLESELKIETVNSIYDLIIFRKKILSFIILILKKIDKIILI